jgi:hypothetical protein
MVEAPANVGGYTRTIAIVAFVATLAYIGLGVIPDLSEFDLDFTTAIPIAYLFAVFGLSLAAALAPARGCWSKQVLRGIFEGALVAYALVAFVYFSHEPSQRTDGTFRWGTFYVGLLMTGPLFSSVGAAAHLLVEALRRRFEP